MTPDGAGVYKMNESIFARGEWPEILKKQDAYIEPILSLDWDLTIAMCYLKQPLTMGVRSIMSERVDLLRYMRSNHKMNEK